MSDILVTQETLNGREVSIVVTAETSAAAFSSQAKQYRDEAEDIKDACIVIQGSLQGLIDNLDELILLEGSLPELLDIHTNLNALLAVFNKLSVIEDVWDNLTEIQGVYNNLAKITTVYNNLSSIINVEADIVNIDTVATDIAKVILVANDILKVNTVADNIVDVGTVADNMQAILDAPVYADLAEKYATEAEDVEVTTGKYSAKHYSIKAGRSKDLAEALVNSISLGGGSYIEVTYSEITALIVASELVPAQKYLLTDFASVHTIPNTTDTNTPTAEPLVVTALSANTLEPIAFSLSFPQDVIYYHVDNDQTMVDGCTKGYIYRRIDTEKNIDIGFDWRSAKFRRWQIEHDVEDTTGAVANYTKGNVVKKTGTVELYIKLNDAEGKSFTDTSAWRRFEWDNLMYVSPYVSEWLIVDDSFQISIKTSTSYKDYNIFTTAPTIDGVQSAYNEIYNFTVQQNPNDLINYSNAVLFGLNINNNSIGTGFNNISIGNYFYGNTIGDYFNGNTIGIYFYSNTIGDYFNGNTIGIYFYSNTIGDNFSSNTIGSYFNSNTIGDNFSSNSIGNDFNSNAIGTGFGNNTIGTDFYSNSIGNDFYNNTMGTGFKYTITKNIIEALDFTSATHVYEPYTTELIKATSGVIKLVYHNGTSYLTVAPTD